MHVFLFFFFLFAEEKNWMHDIRPKGATTQTNISKIMTSNCNSITECSTTPFKVRLFVSLHIAHIKHRGTIFQTKELGLTSILCKDMKNSHHVHTNITFFQKKPRQFSHFKHFSFFAFQYIVIHHTREGKE